MVLNLDPELEAALNDAAEKKGVAPEAVAVQTLRERFVTVKRIEPRDDWERELFALATDCGVSLSNEAVSSDGIYD